MSKYRRIKYQLRRLSILRGSPRSLALGCALGMFLGIMPVMPLRSVLIFLFAIPSGANLAAAFVVGTIVANPFVLAVWYSLALACGNLLVANAVTLVRVDGMLNAIRTAPGLGEGVSTLLNAGWDILIVLLAGGLVIALPASLVSYVVALRFFSTRQGVPESVPETEKYS